MTKVKISIIGAGSAVFSMSLVRDVCLTEGLKDSTICFMDINKERLDTVYSLAKRYAQETKAKISFSKTLERKEAFQDADFVINTALAGGHERSEIERKVGEKHGYVSGGMRLSYFHQLGLMLSIAQDMEDTCPDAWLILAANPVFDGCTLMTRQTKIKVIGLCHGHYGVYDIARVLGLDRNKITFQAPGLNHCIWLTDFRYEGKDAYPLIDEWIETKAEDYWKNWEGNWGDGQMSRAAVSLYKMFGLFPIGDTVQQNPTIAWWHYVDLETQKRWFNKYGGWPANWSNYLEGLKKHLERLDRIYRDSSMLVSKEFPPKLSGEQHIPIINALVNDQEGKFQVNIPNRGCALEGIPSDVVVEVPGVVSGRGVQAIHVGALPKHLAIHLLRTIVTRMELGLEAFLTGDKSILLNMVLSDHRTRSYEQAQALIEDLLALPFNEDLKKKFK
ncbi:alpha-glucosidase/alpha-galactosidase [Candidatus Bathyarchaeota archaeon]|nr:alpha-glucosidase/alpha-galactosidase [Candidatus Bathyarchaeota archaeon]